MPALIPQAVGFSAVALYLLSFQIKKRNGILICNATARALYVLQYVLLGAWVGAILDVLGMLSLIVAQRKETRFVKRHKKLLLISINTLIVITGVTIAILNKRNLDLLPIPGILIHTSAFWLSNERKIRKLSLLGSPFWFIYNFFAHAYGSAVGDLLSIASILIAMFKYRKKPDKIG